MQDDCCRPHSSILWALYMQRPIKTHGETVCKKILPLCEMEGGEECIH